MASEAAHVGPVESNGAKKRPFEGKGPFRYKNKKQKKDEKKLFTGSNEEVLLQDIHDLLKNQSLEDNHTEPTPESKVDPSHLPERLSELEVHITAMSSTGEGLGQTPSSKHIYVVPFTAPGDIVIAKPHKHFPSDSYSLADFVSVKSASQHRDDSLVKCPYFASCGGCHFQMLPYAYQLFRSLAG